MLERLWNDDLGRFIDDVWSPARLIDAAVVPLTWDTLAPLALPELPDEIGHRLVQEVLLSPDRFWDGVPLAAVALNDLTHTSQEFFWGRRRIWRGPSWVNSACLAPGRGITRVGHLHASNCPAIGF